MAYVYAIRIDGQFTDPIKQFFEKDGGAYLVVKELEDSNPHMHGVLHSDRKPQAVRMAIKRAIPGAGNGAYSCAPVKDLDKYQRYMMKGASKETGAEVLASYGLEYGDPEWQATAHEAYWEENDRISKRRKLENIDDVVVELVRQAGIDWSNREKLAEVYIRELSSRNKPINLFSLRSKLNLLQIKLCPDDRAITDLAAHCCNY